MLALMATCYCSEGFLLVDSILYSYRLPGRFQSLQLNKPQALETQTLQLTDTSLGNVGLEIEWSQRWPGTCSLLMTVRPKAIFINKSSFDLTVLYGKKFCLLQKGEMVISPDGLEVSLIIIYIRFTHNLCCDNAFSQFISSHIQFLESICSGNICR